MAPCKFFDVDEESEIESRESGESDEVDYEEDEELETKELIDIYIINRNHIREQSKSVIPVCGVLLTGAFGLLYFMFSGNNNRIPISPSIVLLLGGAAIVLVCSILTSIISVQASSPLKKLPWTKRLYLSYIVDIYNREHKWGICSIRLLGIALLLFVIIILYFLIEYLLYTPLTDSLPLTQFPKFIIIPFPRLF